MISLLFNKILYQPLFNALVLLYQYLPWHDLGIAIILLTCFIRVILYPLSASSLRAQKKISQLQPKIKEIKKNYKDSKRQTEELLSLYQKEKINPFAGFIPLLIQIPLLIALYKVFLQGIQEINSSLLYSFVQNPGFLRPEFLGFLDLTLPSLSLALIASLLQFFQTKSLSEPGTSKEGLGSDFSQMLQKQSLYVFPLLTFFILFKLPSAIGLYLVATTLFSIVQQELIK